MSLRRILLLAFVVSSPILAQVAAQKIVPISGPPAVGCNSQANVGSVRVQNNLNNSNSPLFVCSKISAGTGATAYAWVNSNGGGGGGGGGGANLSLSNLASVNINTSFLFQAAASIGSSAKPATDLFLVGSGSYGSTYFRLTGTPSGARTITLPDVTGTLLTTASPITLSQGGLGITSGNSGGIPYFSAPAAIASSPALSQNQIVLGGGPGAAPSTIGSLGTSNQVLHGGAGAPSFSSVLNGDIANGTIDLTSKVSGLLPGSSGGTNNGFTQLSGPAGSLKTFTLPNASANVLTDNTAVTVSQGGLGVSSLTAHGVVIGQGPGPVTVTSAGTSGQCFIGNGSGLDPSFQSCPGGGAHNLLSSTHPDTTAATVLRGDIIAGQGSSASWTRLPIGAQYKTLNSGSLDVLWDSVHLDQSAAVSGILTPGNGGTNNAFFAVSGPITSVKTYTFPNASANVLTDNSPVTVLQGGTGLAGGASGGIPYFSSAITIGSSLALPTNGVVLGGGAGAAPTGTAAGAANQVLIVPGAGGAPTFGALDLSQSAAVANLLGSSNGGTANAFTAISGPAGSVKTFTFPNASATILTTNAAVTEVQGGTNQNAYAQGDLLYASAANTLSRLAKSTTAGNVLCNSGAGNNPAWCSNGQANPAEPHTVTFSTTPTFTCSSSTVGTRDTFILSTTLTANITASTLSGCTPGQELNFLFQEDATGGRTVALPTGFSQVPGVCPIANSITKINVWWDGTTAQYLGGGTDICPGVLTTQAAPSTNPSSGSIYMWADSTNNTVGVRDSSGNISWAPRQEACTNQVVTALGTNGRLTCNGVTAAMLPAQYKTLSCQPGLGDGLNAMAAGTYLESTCWNKTGVTITLTAIQCFTDNAGSSTMNATNGAGTGLLTGAVTCSSTIASGTQSATTTIANNDFIKFTFVADGTSKQTTWVISETY